MQFVYDESCGVDVLEVKDEVYNYLIKARRHKVEDNLYFRNLKDNNIYLYKISFIDRKKALLNFISKEEKIVGNKKKVHIGWCVVDPKIIEKSIPFLNEIGVDKITFIYAEYSQKNFQINIEKLQKILINSSSQCGRSDIIKLEISKNLQQFLKENEEAYFLDFSNTLITDKKEDIKTLVIGCEGGFSENERKTFNKNFIVGLDSTLILRTETAAISASAKLII